MRHSKHIDCSLFKTKYLDHDPTNSRYYYAYLDLPKVPLNFVKEAFDESQNPKGHWFNPILDEHIDREIILPDGTVGQSSGYPRYRLSLDFEDWLKENIIPNFIDEGVTFTQRSNRSILGAHTDRTRAFSLLYVIQTGGAEVVTRWYDDLEKPRWRPRPSYQDDHTKLKLIAETEIPANQWICINTQVIHTVEQVQTQRIGFNLSFNHDYFGLDGAPFSQPIEIDNDVLFKDNSKVANRIIEMIKNKIPFDTVSSGSFVADDSTALIEQYKTHIERKQSFKILSKEGFSIGNFFDTSELLYNHNFLK